MAWQDVLTQVEKDLSTIYHDRSPQPVDIVAATTGQKMPELRKPDSQEK